MSDCPADRLSVSLGPFTLAAPVMNASGTGGYGTEALPFLIPERLGAFVTKGLSLNPRPGNPPPRIAETAAGMLNAIGLENIGIESFLRHHLPVLHDKGVTVVANFFGVTEEDYAAAAERLSQAKGIHALEVNVSCPNIKKGGLSFGRDPEVVHRLVRVLRGATSMPLIVKLTPDAVEIVRIAEACWEGGCDALTVANTYPGLSVDIRRRRPRLSIGAGGLSGPAIRPLTLWRVWQITQVSPVPVIGVGGITSCEDALEYLIAGAAAVQVGSGVFANPEVFSEISDGIVRYLDQVGAAHVGEIIGTLEWPDADGRYAPQRHERNGPSSHRERGKCGMQLRTKER
jgi:dihydroorotate dehydrogenase (NAD+) catalytic subunit